MGLSFRDEEIARAFSLITAFAIVFLYLFDMEEVYLDPYVTTGSFGYESLVEILLLVSVIYLLSVVAGNAYNLAASSSDREGG